MNASVNAQATPRAQQSVGVNLGAAAVRLTPVALFALALVLRLLGTAFVRFPMTEGSAYYTTVATNLATGRGPVIDAIWSYGTPPLTLPRPAFELWQPLASFLAAVPMPFLGAEFETAQLAFAVAGALMAPLTWYVARDAACRLHVPERRAITLSVGAGVLAALSGPLLLATVIPDSTLPFTVLAVAACIAMPSALAGNKGALIGLGVLSGLAYLTRMEAIYLAVAFVALGMVAHIGWRTVIGRAAVVAGVAAVIALPWWLRNLSVFGSTMPGQVADNIFLTRNEQIFAYAEKPTLDAFLGQGAATIALNIAEAFRHDLVNVMLVPSIAVVGVALISIVVGRRHAAALSGSALGALLVLGTITFVVTSVVFPVATLWGTFEHASGPLLVALIVCAALGADAFVARVQAWRDWPRSNAWLAPAVLIALTVPLTLLQITGVGSQSRQEQQRFAALGSELPAVLDARGVDAGAPLISDRPVWLAAAMGRPAIALPDEPTSDVLRLARDFGSSAVVVVEARGRHPFALANDRGCFSEIGPISSGPAGSAQITRVFLIAELCR
jgi:hypothetical protein